MPVSLLKKYTSFAAHDKVLSKQYITHAAMANLMDRFMKKKNVKEPVSESASEPASCANTMVEKPAEPTKAGPATEEDPIGEDPIGEDQYPKGIKFVFILLALVLSIFMVALDLVCSLFFFDPQGAYG